MGITRRSRDHRNCQKFLEWLQQRNPFLYEDNCRHSLSLGMISDECDAVNCDQAEEVGQTIQDQLDGISILASKIKRKDQVRSLISLQNNSSWRSGLC